MGMIFRPSGICWTTLAVIAMKAKKVANINIFLQF